MQNHGWKRAAVLLAIPAAIAAVGGIWIGIESQGGGRDPLVLVRMQEVGGQSRLIVDNLFATIDAIRSQAQGIAQAGENAQPGGAILHFAEFALEGDRIGAAIRQAAGTQLQAKSIDAAFTESYLLTLPERLSLREMRENGVSVVRVKRDAQSPGEWLALGFPSSRKGARSVVAALIDPAEGFSVFKRFVSRSDGGALRAYLLGADGQVLAHSVPSYVNSNFSATALFNESIRPLMQGTRLSGSGMAQAIDSQKVVVGYSRPGTLPLAVVVERITSRESVGAQSGAFQRVAGQALGWLGAVLAALAFALFRLTRSAGTKNGALETGEGDPRSFAEMLSPAAIQAPAEVIPAQEPVQSAVVPGAMAATAAPDTHGNVLEAGPAPAMPAAEAAPAFQAPVHAMQAKPAASAVLAGPVVPAWAGTQAREAAWQIENQVVESHFLEAQNAAAQDELRRRYEAADHALQKKKREEEAVSRFEKEASRLRDPKAVAHRLTTLSAELCGSPTLYFAFHPGVKAAILQADAGFAPGEAPAGMSFPIDAATHDRLLGEAQAGRVPGLAGHAPLGRIIMARMGVAHFEAWAVTGYGHLGRAAGKPRLLGVLVILQAGTDSISQEDTLGRMMRATGLIYENALLSQ